MGYTAKEILQKETDGFEEQSRLRDDVLDAMEKYANQRVIEELKKQESRIKAMQRGMGHS